MSSVWARHLSRSAAPDAGSLVTPPSPTSASALLTSVGSTAGLLAVQARVCSLRLVATPRLWRLPQPPQGRARQPRVNARRCAFSACTTPCQACSLAAVTGESAVTLAHITRGQERLAAVRVSCESAYLAVGGCQGRASRLTPVRWRQTPPHHLCGPPRRAQLQVHSFAFLRRQQVLALTSLPCASSRVWLQPVSTMRQLPLHAVRQQTAVAAAVMFLSCDSSACLSRTWPPFPCMTAACAGAATGITPRTGRVSDAATRFGGPQVSVSLASLAGPALPPGAAWRLQTGCKCRPCAPATFDKVGPTDH